MLIALRQGIGIDRRILWEAVACVAPGMALVALGQPRLGARLYFGILCALLLYHLLRRDRFSFLALTVATTPIMMLLRSAFVYSSVIAILAAGIVVWVLTAPGHIQFMKSDALVTAFLAATAGYWLLSFVLSGQYDVNIRALELSLSAVNVYLLGHRRRALGTALLGIFISTTLMSLALLPSGGRLGQVTFDELTLGNPISLGLAAALILLLAVADGGRWILSPTRGRRGLVIIALSGLFLLLSTSRGSWLVVLACFGLMFALSPRARPTLAVVVALLGIILLAVLQSGRGSIVVNYFDKAMSSERSTEQRTSGRSEQWKALPLMLRDSPVWGFGPGMERQVSYLYTGVGRTMHSFYLHIIAETGLIGFSVLLVLMFPTIGRGARHYRLTGETVPLLAIAGFLTIGLTVSAFDAISGVYLGLALLGTRQPFFRLVMKVPSPVLAGMPAAGQPGA
jgi:O-antigen ligase